MISFFVKDNLYDTLQLQNYTSKSKNLKIQLMMVTCFLAFLYNSGYAHTVFFAKANFCLFTYLFV